MNTVSKLVNPFDKHCCSLSSIKWAASGGCWHLLKCRHMFNDYHLMSPGQTNLGSHAIILIITSKLMLAKKIPKNHDKQITWKFPNAYGVEFMCKLDSWIKKTMSNCYFKQTNKQMLSSIKKD